MQEVDQIHAPVLACLSVWQVLNACGGSQAELDEFLQIGSRFLNQVAGQIREERLRESYLEQVQENQQLRRLIHTAGLDTKKAKTPDGSHNPAEHPAVFPAP
jgi:hypothetical protein